MTGLGDQGATEQQFFANNPSEPMAAVGALTPDYEGKLLLAVTAAFLDSGQSSVLTEIAENDPIETLQCG